MAHRVFINFVTTSNHVIVSLFRFCPSKIKIYSIIPENTT